MANVRQLDKSDKPVMVYYKCSNLGSKLVHRNMLPHNNVKEVANVVYQFTCAYNNKISYIGMTTRKLGDRIKEHKNARSPIGRHILGCNECCKSELEDRFRILVKDKVYDNLRVAEALKIREFEPVLNGQLENGGVSFFLRIA